MFIAAQEWFTTIEANGKLNGRANGNSNVSSEKPPAGLLSGSSPRSLAALYQALASSNPPDNLRRRAAEFLESQIAEVSGKSCDLPAAAEGLEAWMLGGAQLATTQYKRYLVERKAGGPRRYFGNRAHALYFLRSVSPTKLVDGAWLYGLIAHWRNPRFSDLIRTYVEELGEGEADKNHVAIYRQLLARYGLASVEDLDDRLYTQGIVQLALAYNAEDFLPEVIGFNLGYEQLPLHLLITAYELNELGIDPYYFTLHVTVDNTDNGHARRAVQALKDTLPRVGDPTEFWRRVRVGYLLGNAGVDTHQIIEGFKIDREVTRIFSRKRVAGHGAHSDYCRVGGRSINDWLARPEDMPGLLAALQASGWIKPGAPVVQSRFWNLLHGPRAEMFGVFTSYELQVVHDWIRGAASRDGQSCMQASLTDGQQPPRQPSFRAAAQLAVARGYAPLSGTAMPELLDTDLSELKQQLPLLDSEERTALLLDAMAPSQHWTPAGLFATRLFCQCAT